MKASKKWIWMLLSGALMMGLTFNSDSLFAQGPSGQEKKETKTEGNASTTEVKKTPKDLPYTVVAERNIFSPERKEFPLMTQSAPMGEIKKPIVRPQVILYGVTITEEYQSATLSNPGMAMGGAMGATAGGAQRRGEREVLTLKAGEKLGEYKIAKILPDRIVLESGEDSFEVLLNDPKNPKRRTSVRTEVKPATVATATPSPPPAASPAPPPATPAPERVTPPPATQPATPTYPMRPGRGRVPASPTPGGPVPTTPSEITPMTPVTPTPIPPPTSVPVPMTPRSIPVSPPTPVPVGPGGPTPQVPGGQ